MPVARQWLCNHVAATEADATVNGLLEKKHMLVEELLEAVFIMQSAPRLYTRDQNGTVVSS
jgi:hypothetical protein